MGVSDTAYENQREAMLQKLDFPTYLFKGRMWEVAELGVLNQFTERKRRTFIEHLRDFNIYVYVNWQVG